MRLINADALMEIYADRMSALAERYSIDSYACGTLAGAMKLLETQPTIEQPTGKWERHYSRPNVYADLYWHCSNCGYKTDERYANRYYKFCPHCGARMEGEE